MKPKRSATQFVSFLFVKLKIIREFFWRIFDKMKKYITGFAKISFIVTAASIAIYIISIGSFKIADAINNSVSISVRFLLSRITHILPFSLFELLVILSPIILVLVVSKALKRARSHTDMIRGVITIFAVVSLVFTSYIFTLGIGYHTTPLADKIDVEERTELTAEELYYTLSKVVEGVNSSSFALRIENGESTMPYSKKEMSRRLIEAYDNMNERYSLVVNYTSRVKPVYFSTVMSDLGISGIYSFFTGEANVNVEYPDYCLPFTAAHELAHQRGICRENEANFVAFLVCISSDDEYIRYSGYLNMYEYLASALYKSDRELYYDAVKKLPTMAISDIKAANAVYEKHKDSPLGKINDRLNDAYLKANGTEGVVSYGYVVRLAVGYYQKEGE